MDFNEFELGIKSNGPLLSKAAADVVIRSSLGLAEPPRNVLHISVPTTEPNLESGLLSGESGTPCPTGYFGALGCSSWSCDISARGGVWELTDSC